jgi:hypothetical protein
MNEKPQRRLWKPWWRPRSHDMLQLSGEGHMSRDCTEARSAEVAAVAVVETVVP